MDARLITDATIEQDATRKQLAAALARIAGGDRQALKLVYRDTSAKLFAVCHRILQDKGEAEDVLQEVYIAVWRRAGAFDPNRASPISWLVAIARNRSIDRLRSRAILSLQRSADEAAEVSDSAPTALAQLEISQEHRRLMHCLDELEPQHAGAIRSAFFEGVTYDELAQRMNVPLGTMKSWIRRSLLRLRQCLSDEPTSGAGTLVAAEYVLGVLSAEERRAVQARIAREPALRAEIEYWEQRLGPLASELEAIDPPPQVWPKIEAALAADAHRGTLWQNLPFWRWAAIGSAAVAAASIAAFVYVARIQSANVPLVAKLESNGGGAGFVVAIDTGSGGLTIVPAALADVSQRALELWLIVPGEQPRSLGLIEAGRAVHIDVPADLLPRVAPQSTLAISLEPLGGSPTGLPTGPVIASGKLTKL